MDPAIDGRIDQAVERSMDEGNMAGCVVLVGRRAGIVFEKAYGNRSVEPEKEEMTTDTVFDMASLTKPVATATSVMILVERGKLRLDDKVAKFIPEFAANGKEDVTVEQLLVHSSGLIPDNPLDDYDDGWKSAKPKICDLKLLSKPGTAFKYSDVNFILLGKIVESGGRQAGERIREGRDLREARHEGHRLSAVGRIASPRGDDRKDATASGSRAKCTIRGRRRWAAWPGMRACSARPRIWRSTRK